MVNWLIVGLGDVAHKRVLPALRSQPQSAIYGVVTRDHEKGKAISERVWADLSEALRDPGIDAVYVATPVFLHCRQTVLALEAGKHVLCEKPAAMNHRQASEMVAAAKAAGRLLGIAYFRRYYPKLRRAKDLLHAGSIGRVRSVVASCAEHFTGDLKRGWLSNRESAGSGPLYDIGSHRIDAVNFLCGEPRTIAAHLLPDPKEGAVESSAEVSIVYPGDVCATVSARWDVQEPLDEFRLVGDEGEMELSPLNGPRIRYPGGEEDLPCHENRHFPCIDNFVGAILNGAPLACSGEACLAAARALDDALRLSGRRSALHTAGNQ